MIFAIEPGKLGIAREEISPAFKGLRRNDAKLGDLIHDGSAGVGGEDISPELRSWKLPANIHYEADSLLSFFFAFAGECEDDIERGANAGFNTAGSALIDGSKVLKVFVHCL